MRVPVAVSLESRDGAVTRDAKVLNGIVETRGEQLSMRKRPGNSDLGLVKAGVAQLLTVWNGIKTIQADYLNSGTIATVISAPTQTSLTPTNASLQFTAQATNSDAATPRLMFKNRSQAWTVNRSGTVTAVTYGGSMGANTYTLLSLTRSGGTATGTMGEDAFNVGDSVVIAGATPIAYNGTVTVTAVTASSSEPSIDIPITVTRSGTTATATTVSGAHGLTTATAYTIAGANDSAYNGSKTITVTGATTFTYTVTVTTGATATLNSGDKEVDITLSGGNLTATISTANKEGCVRATQGKSGGKWYWEVNIAAGGLDFALGVANLSASMSAYLGSTANSWAYYSTGRKANGTFGAYGSFYVSGDTIGVALDMDSGTLTFYRNGVSQGQAFSGITGTVYPVLYLRTADPSVGSTPTCEATANFGASTFAFGVPSGFSAGVTLETPTSPASGSIIVTKPGAAINPTFSYTVAGSPATPATGTITAQGTGGTVPGIAYINGYFCVMDTSGVIWNSNSDDPTTWGALNFITAQSENGAGKALAKSQNYLIAFKEWSTEYFFDNANSVGSPFSPVDNGFTQIGCASGDSVAEIDGALMWVSQSEQESSRGVYLMRGLEQQKVSTPDVDRILNGDNLATVYAYGMKLDGHSLYVLTLVSSGITIVYDLTSQAWVQWSSMTIGSSKAVTSIHRGSTASGLELSGSSTAGDAYFVQVIDTAAYTVVTSDVLQYEVFIDPSAPLATTFSDGGVTLFFTDGSTANAVTDADGFAMAQPAVGFDPLARGIWKARSFSLAAHIGKTVSSWRVRNDSDGVGHHRSFYRNIKIVRNSVTQYMAYETSGAPKTNALFTSALTDNRICGEGSLHNSSTYAVAHCSVAHGVVDGSPVKVAGATQTEYNGIFLASYINDYTFAFEVQGLPVSTPTGTITAFPYTESYFKFTKAANFGGRALLLHESDGHLYQVSSSVYRDAGLPIKAFTRTARMDGGTTDRKKLIKLRAVGDNVSASLSARWSDDDCETFTPYRMMDLSEPEPELRRCGAFKRRAIELCHIANTTLRMDSIELEIGK